MELYVELTQGLDFNIAIDLLLISYKTAYLCQSIRSEKICLIYNLKISYAYNSHENLSFSLAY